MARTHRGAERGFALLALLGVVAVLVLLGAGVFYASTPSPSQGTSDLESDAAVEEEVQIPVIEAQKSASPPPPPPRTSTPAPKPAAVTPTPPPSVPTPSPAPQNTAVSQGSSHNTFSNEPPLKLKSIGIEFSDFVFTKQKTQFNRMFMGYGFIIDGSQTNTGQSKANPQPTFMVPLGTPVRSLVDGKVAAISQTWAGDYSIMVTKSGSMERWAYETEHVLNPKVKVGDMVVAGQVIAEVSNFDKNAPTGYGAFEIGILKGGQVAEHVCPFTHLDESIRATTLQKIRELFISWEAYVGDATLYDENEAVPGCVTLAAIEG